MSSEKPIGEQISENKHHIRISVKVHSEWILVPCLKDQTIRWLCDEAVKRAHKLSTTQSDNKCINAHTTADTQTVDRSVYYQVRRTQGGVLLDPDDTISHVLSNNDFVSLITEANKGRVNNFNGDKNDSSYTSTDFPTMTQLDSQEKQVMYLDGNSLSTDDLVQLGKGHYKIQLTKEAASRLIESRELVDKIVNEQQVVYGVTTGFGKFSDIVISSDKIQEAQLNLIRSHAAGVGKPLSPHSLRMLLALRVNVLAKGCSGITPDVVHKMIDAFNSSCLPWVPEKGSVGASGDLAPLAHLALGLMGEGKMWSEKTGWADAKYVLDAHGLQPIQLSYKDGIAMINGTQLIASIGAEAVERAASIARQADVVAAITLEVLKGTSRAFDSDVHQLRPHCGQKHVAHMLRALLHSDTHPSEIAESHRFCNRVQDSYTLRCCPQVHGVAHDTVTLCKRWLTTELNSATDNPIVLAKRGEIISAGNFHGEYPAKALDFLAIGVHELASMSERRVERLCNPAYSGLPAFLVRDGGLNSGFMMAHVTAAALVSENKVLCHPSSVDSISTSAGTEDHVSMGAWSARKALTVVENVERVIAVELLAACQAIEFLRPLSTTAPLEDVYRVVRSQVRPWTEDRFMAPDIDTATNILRQELVWNTVKHHIDHYDLVQNVETRVFSPTTVHIGSGRAPPRAKRTLPTSSNHNNPSSNRCSSNNGAAKRSKHSPPYHANSTNSGGGGGSSNGQTKRPSRK